MDRFDGRLQSASDLCEKGSANRAALIGARLSRPMDWRGLEKFDLPALNPILINFLVARKE